MKIVGILLVISLLIIPAAAARRLSATPEQMAVIAAIIGALSVAAGLFGSLRWDIPAGPAIVVAATVCFVAIIAWPRRRLADTSASNL
jgi:zinc transport system permease protein